MDPISSSSLGSGLEINAMKKAMDVQEQGILKVLESASPTQNVSGSEITGLGQTLDIRA